jgi:phytanoyl-CoA hydroxylase
MVATEPKLAQVTKETYSQAKNEVSIDPFENAAYDGHLYEHHGVLKGIDGWPAYDAHEDECVAYFDEHGFLAIEEALTPAEVESSLAGLLDLIDGKRSDYRHIQFEAAAKGILHTLPVEQKQDYVRKIFHFVDYDARLRAIAEHPKILSMVEQLIGEKPALYESKALLKPPMIGREKPWHQDHAYWNLPLDAKVVTIWIALDPATVENGCLFVVPGSHNEGPVVHFRRRDWQICDTDVRTGRIMAAPLASGGALIFHSMLHHGTPANASHDRRRALQFVYVPASVGKISTPERLAIFGSEGKDVSC